MTNPRSASNAERTLTKTTEQVSLMADLSKTPSRKNRKAHDWPGLKFGRITVLRIVGKEGPKNTLLAECKCDCGTVKTMRVTYLSEGTQSCGCLVKEINSLPTEERPKSKIDRSAWTPEQKEANRLRKIEWVKSNPKKVAALAKRCREKDPAKTKAIKSAFYQANKKKIVGRTMERYHSDPRFRIEMLCRGRITVAIRKRGTRKSARTMALVGCTVDELMKHLESTFQPGMTWENRHEWHIDHVKPLKEFRILDEAEQKAAFHYTNLQALWGVDNLSKKARLDWTPAESKRIKIQP